MSHNRQVFELMVSIYAYVSTETLCARHQNPQLFLNLQLLTNKTEPGIQLPQFKSKPIVKKYLYLSYYNLLRFMCSVVKVYFNTSTDRNTFIYLPRTIHRICEESPSREYDP